MRTPHEPETVAAVRVLFEGSTLNYAEIGRRTGVSQASVCRYAHAGGWRRPPGAPKSTSFANGLPSSKLKGRLLARRLRDICGRYLDEMERTPDLRDIPDCGTVLTMLRMAKEEERRRPRVPLAARARAIAERYLDQLEADPERELEQLAWVLKMLEAARQEEERQRRRPRGPLAARAREIAERYLDQLEADPERELEQLAWVLKMLEAARQEEALARKHAGDPHGG